MSNDTLAARAEYIREHITVHTNLAGVTWLAVDKSMWASLPGLSPTDRACGWMSPVVDYAAHRGDREPLVIRFCPEVIAETTATLPISPVPDGPIPWVDQVDPDEWVNDPEAGDRAVLAATWYLDNYVRALEAVLDTEALLWDQTEYDPVLRRQLAEDAMWDMHPASMMVLSMVQMRALDGTEQGGRS